MDNSDFLTLYRSPQLIKTLASKASFIRNMEDREDAIQEAWTAILESNAKTVAEARLIGRAAIDAIYDRSKTISRNETSLHDAGLDD